MGFLDKLKGLVPKKDKTPKHKECCSTCDFKMPEGTEFNWTLEQWQQHVGKKLTLERYDTDQLDFVYELVKPVLCGDRILLLMKDDSGKEMVFETRTQEEFYTLVLAIDGVKIDGGYLSLSDPMDDEWVNDVKSAL